MSYILEALRKSEEDRRRQAGFESDLAEPLAPASRRRRPWTSMVLATALLLNAAVLGTWLLRDTASNDGASASLTPDTPGLPSTLPEPTASTPTPVEIDPVPAIESPPVDWSEYPVRSLSSLTMVERRRFERLRISTHVYAEEPAFREVSIDGRIYREGERIEGMPLVAITANGIQIGFDGRVIAIDLQEQWDL